MELHEIIFSLSVLALSAQSALSDIDKWRISNQSLALWTVGGVIYELAFFGGANIADKIIGAFLPALLLGMFFLFRMLGAGDIKLFCVLGIWLGAEDILKCMLFSFLIGAGISIVKIVINKNAAERLNVLVRYFANVGQGAGIKSNALPDYGAKRAGSARVNVCVFAFFSVMLKLMEVY